MGQFADADIVGDAKAGIFADMAARSPAARIVSAADVAPACLYFMESDFTMGETIRIDGRTPPQLAIAVLESPDCAGPQHHDYAWHLR